MREPGVTAAFAVSISLHIAVLLMQLPHAGRFHTQEAPQPLEIIYEYELAKEEVRQLQERLARTKREALTAPAPSGSAVSYNIRIPRKHVLDTTPFLPALLPERSSVVDLTNLVEAAQGNPILLSYFGAIREQIQTVANRQTWTTGEGKGGVIYTSFVLLASGQIYSVSVAGSRSAPSQTLRNIALRIVQSAAPFPAFPPSMKERMKTVIVPLEFLVGS